jgi:hypothetical protein
MHIFGTDIDLNRNEAKNFRWENGIALPTVGASDSGLTFYHSGLSKFYGWTGATWIDLGASGGGSYTLPTATDTILGGVKIDGTTITIDGAGVISSTQSAIIPQDDGNGIGYVLADRDNTKYTGVGLGSIDLTITGASEPDSDYGVSSPGGFSTGSANKLPAGVGNFGAHQAHGYGNTVEGYYGNMAYGAYNNITDGYNFVTFGYSNSGNMTSTVGHGFSAGGFNSSTSYWNNALGFRISASAKGFTGVGLANTVYSGSATATDRPAFTVGIGDAVSSSGASYGDIISRKDGLVVKFNAEVVAPETTIAIIDAEATGKALTTKEWVSANVVLTTTTQTVSGVKTFTSQVNCPRTLFTSNLALAPAVVNIGRHNDNFYIGGTGGATTNHFTLEAGWGGGDTTLREFVFPSYDGDIAVVKTVPSSSTDVGDVGNIAIDSSYIYVCTATDTWRRVATSTW